MVNWLLFVRQETTFFRLIYDTYKNTGTWTRWAHVNTHTLTSSQVLNIDVVVYLHINNYFSNEILVDTNDTKNHTMKSSWIHHLPFGKSTDI